MVQNALYTGDLAQVQQHFPEQAEVNLVIQARSHDLRWTSQKWGESSECPSVVPKDVHSWQSARSIWKQHSVHAHLQTCLVPHSPHGQLPPSRNMCTIPPSGEEGQRAGMEQFCLHFGTRQQLTILIQPPVASLGGGGCQGQMSWVPSSGGGKITSAPALHPNPILMGPPPL